MIISPDGFRIDTRLNAILVARLQRCHQAAVLQTIMVAIVDTRQPGMSPSRYGGQTCDKHCAQMRGRHFGASSISSANEAPASGPRNFVTIQEAVVEPLMD
jgi:hypothetical protein